jgi:hypothetical protein
MDFNEALSEVDMKERYKNDPLINKITDTYWEQWKKSDSDEKISRMEFLERYKDRILMSAYSFISIEIDKMAKHMAEMEEDPKLIALYGKKLQ